MNYPQAKDLPSWEKLREQFTIFSSWEERYRALLLLSKQLPPVEARFKSPDYEIDGCESKSWLINDGNDIWIDSQARIIKGMMVIILTLVNQPPVADLNQINIVGTLDKLGLRHYISQSRINGIQAIWQQIIALNT